ncbi:MAG: hypothetical protein K2X86_14360, partial [Cytophagaceae bacterium]|nr:hypothetical protein [Cytophagaceae bacterium]
MSIITLILYLSHLSFSQPFIDIVNLKTQRFAPVNYNKDENREVSVNQLTLNINLPIPLKNKDILISGITYDELIFRTSNADRRNLYSFLIQIGYLK